MKTNIKPKSNIKSKIMISIVSSLLLAGACFLTLEKLNVTNFTDTIKTTDVSPNQVINNNPPTQEQKDAGEQQKINDQQTPSDLSVTISSLATNSDYVLIRSVVVGAISNDGTCNLQLTKIGTDISLVKTAETYALPSSSACKGFDISRSELSTGDWKLKLTVTINNETGSIEKNFTLE